MDGQVRRLNTSDQMPFAEIIVSLSPVTFTLSSAAPFSSCQILPKKSLVSFLFFSFRSHSLTFTMFSDIF